MTETNNYKYTDLPVCPYCDFEHYDSWEWDMNDEDVEVFNVIHAIREH